MLGKLKDYDIFENNSDKYQHNPAFQIIGDDVWTTNIIPHLTQQQVAYLRSTCHYFYDIECVKQLKQEHRIKLNNDVLKALKRKMQIFARRGVDNDQTFVSKCQSIRLQIHWDCYLSMYPFADFLMLGKSPKRIEDDITSLFTKKKKKVDWQPLPKNVEQLHLEFEDYKQPYVVQSMFNATEATAEHEKDNMSIRRQSRLKIRECREEDEWKKVIKVLLSKCKDHMKSIQVTNHQKEHYEGHLDLLLVISEYCGPFSHLCICCWTNEIRQVIERCKIRHLEISMLSLHMLQSIHCLDDQSK
ncbi:hypothetical protein RFI_09055, partial [Reticulomyxa filosa]